MSLRQYIENHPVMILGGFIVSAVATTAAFIDYLGSKRLELVQATHESKVEALHLEYRKQVDDFAQRLGKIERRVGENPEYFDVSTIIIGRERIKSLSDEYEEPIEGYLFVFTPKGPSWSYESSNDLSLMSEILGLGEGDVAGLLADDLAGWRLISGRMTKPII